MNGRRGIAWLTLATLLIAACESRSDDIIRFEEIATDDVKAEWQPPGQDETAVRTRWVHYEPAVLDSLAAEGASLEFELFEGTVLPITVGSVGETDLGQTQIIAQVDDEEFSVFWLTSSDSGLSGRVQTLDRMYSIATVEQGVIRITEYDQGSFPPDIELDEESPLEFDRHEAFSDEPFIIGHTIAQSVVRQRRGPLIRVMVLLPAPVYRVLCNDEQRADVAAMISLGINQVWRTSAHAEVVAACIRYLPQGTDYVDFRAQDPNHDRDDYIALGEDPYADLTWLTSSTSAKNLREQFKADLVTLIVPVLAYCGVAKTNMPPILATEHAKAFSVVRADCVEGNYSIQHELGHLMGMRHDRHAYSSDVPGDCNYGYQCRRQAKYMGRTVMASKNACENLGYSPSQCKVRFPLHSTTRRAGDVPELSASWQCGNACSVNSTDDWVGAAHNYKQLQDAAPIIGGYR